MGEPRFDILRLIQSTVGLALLTSLNGCGGITAQVLTTDGKYPDGLPGFRYYLPRPYLLVMALPPDGTIGSDDSNQAPESPLIHAMPPRPGHPLARGPAPPAASAAASKKQNPTTGTPDKTTPSTAPTSDTSYLAQNTRYLAKLVYMQDFTHPASIEVHAGLFGIASFQPTFVDGWMLTGFQGSIDNTKNADVATALLTALTTVASGPAGAAAKAVKPPRAGAPAESGELTAANVLPPGYYGFETSPDSGLLHLCVATLFSATSSAPVPPCSAAVASNASAR